MSVSGARFYELVKPQRVVGAFGSGLHELTSRGWRRAPWWWWAVRIGRIEDDENGLKLRCLQRLNVTTLRADPLPESWVLTATRFVWQWVAPPLPFGAPTRFDAALKDDAAAKCADSISSKLSNDELEDLIHEASAGYRAHEARIAAVEARAGAFEGYAAAAAGIAAVGAALLSGDRKTFGGESDYALIAALVVAVFCLILSGVRAYQAAAKRFSWLEPNDADRILRRAVDAADDRRRARLCQLAALLIASTRADLLADWKLDRSKQATRYFSFALIWVIVSAVLLVLPD